MLPLPFGERAGVRGGTLWFAERTRRDILTLSHILLLVIPDHRPFHKFVGEYEHKCTAKPRSDEFYPW